MPIHFKYNPGNSLLYGSIEGQVNIEELGQTLGKITDSKEFPPDVKALWDLRKVDFTQLNSNFGEALASLRRQNPKRGNTKIALVVEKDLGYGMCRMYVMLSEDLPQEVSVFKDIASAENWLLGEDKLILKSG